MYVLLAQRGKSSVFEGTQSLFGDPCLIDCTLQAVSWLFAGRVQFTSAPVTWNSPCSLLMGLTCSMCVCVVWNSAMRDFL